MNDLAEFYQLGSGLQPYCVLVEGWQFQNLLCDSCHVIPDKVPEFDGSLFGDDFIVTRKGFRNTPLEGLLGKLVLFDLDQTSEVPYFLYLVI